VTAREKAIRRKPNTPAYAPLLAERDALRQIQSVLSSLDRRNYSIGNVLSAGRAGLKAGGAAVLATGKNVDLGFRKSELDCIGQRAYKIFPGIFFVQMFAVCPIL